jgi:LysM domain
MRSSATVLILISFFFAKFARSQSNELIIQGQTGKLYLEHTVVAKENWYSVGRLYNVNAKELAPFNKLTLGQPLIIGETLEIPLTPTNFSQNGIKAAGETLVPVIHITQEKEWMYRISVNYNKVPIPNIEKWNNVTPDQIHPGLHLIVGYLKVKTALSALATNVPASASPAPPVATTTKPATAPAPPAVAPATSTPNASVPATSVPVTSAPATSTSSVAPTTKPATPTPTTPKPTTVVTKPVTTDSPVASTPTTSTPNASAPVASHSVAPSPATSAPAPPAPHFNGGAFRGDFNDGGKSASGMGGIFKSTSGWQDGKYYALMNNMTVGTIVRITDPSTNKTVYAKILGQLPEMKESAGLSIRMSNAAAAELGESDNRFNVQINY